MFGKKEEKSDDKKISEEKSAQLEEKISQNIVVHKMPKNYKAGTFSYNDYFNNETKSDGSKSDVPSEAHTKGKKTGIIIMVIGFIIIGVLAYGAFVYLKTPDKFNFFSFFQKKTIVPVVPTPIVPIISTPVVTTTPIFEIATTTEEIATTTVTTTPEIIAPVTIVDNDADGLNDFEEEVLKTDANMADSDGDKYNDLTELIGGYNPAGSGKLSDNDNIKKYTNVSYKYDVLYPKNWKLDLVDKGASVVFTANDQSFIQVVTQSNDKKLDIKKWYETEFATSIIDNQIVKYNNWEGIKSVDGFVVYLTDQSLKNIYIISYTPVSDQTLSYLNIFEMMMRSFVINK